LLQIYHNPRCRKSREALQLLQERSIDHEVILYLEKLLSKKELKELLHKINLLPSQVVRKNEAEWKALPNRNAMGEDEIVDALIAFPKLLERPIIVGKEKGVLARPLDQLVDFLSRD